MPIRSSPSRLQLANEVKVGFAGKAKGTRAAGLAVLLLASFLYVIWKFGALWPGVPPMESGMFRLKQVKEQNLAYA